MRKIDSILLVAVLALLSCTEQNMTGAVVNEQNILYAATPGSEEKSKVAIQQPEGNKAALFWSEGDTFVAYDQNYQGVTYRLTSGANSAQGAFSTDEVLKDKIVKAVFPASDQPELTEKELKMTLPNAYSAGDNSQNLPLWATVNETQVRFQHLMGVFHMDLDKLDQNFTSITVETSNIIAGDFVLNVQQKEYALKANNALSDNKKVTLAVKGGEQVYVPLPEGTYESIKVYGVSAGTEYVLLQVKNRKVLAGHLYTIKNFNAPVKVADAWTMFNENLPGNVLLDFSYAGYKHGEMAPPEGVPAGYEVINVKEEMELNGLSARETFIALLKSHNMLTMGDFKKSNGNAKVVFYFPEGDYVLHNEADNIYNPKSKNTQMPGMTATPYDPNNHASGKKDVVYGLDSNGNNKSLPIIITGGNFIIRGDGRGKTRLIMATPNLPNDQAVLYSSPDLIQIKNNAWLPKDTQTDKYSTVTGSAAKGTFSVEVSEPLKFSVGQWVCLHLEDNKTELIAKELFPYKWESTMSNISEKGVQVQDYHQIKSIDGNTITFVEPIMHEVDPTYKWTLRYYFTYENVGVEDLTFVGHCVDDFKHHRSWIDDGAYKPLSFSRMANSWIRRVDFENVSEAMSIISSVNCSAYDINITGNRGHSAIRSAGSSRIFIGKVVDRTAGPLVVSGALDSEAGQYHACGASKPSMGAVIWNVRWGLDSNFESHATQPRATLIDHCSGGFHQLRQGGAAEQVPNHLADLTIWNMNVEREPEIREMSPSGHKPANGEYDWWRMGTPFWKIMPPIVVGIHGYPVTFVQEQMKYEESNGAPVEPQSLYEAQLKRRLGAVPAWLQQLK